ncbi:mitochondrial glycoprotein [Amylocarpus encephaloides]|uniref:Mitochondrial glycoprotein n=1 Tax=Amylocarpus encephaloides TaxID=45428 RepID=A0A9P7YBV8_9HELO|nr:mitochondrial glycoprotein [Amylocarpus encephaloides]
MFSIRSLTRSAPRTISRLSTSALRQPRARTSLVLSAWKPSRTQSVAAFSGSARRMAKAAEGDEELVLKLDSELQVENDMKEQEGVPTSVKEYLENGPFEILDSPGQEDVVLTRQFGGEKIQITFSIADINNLDNENEYEDPAMADEEDANQASEESTGEEGEGADGEAARSYPARLNIVIEKAGKGALNVEGIIQDGMHVIENVYYYADASFAYAKTPEKIHGREDLYSGPPFANLDEDLQVLFERYLDERGINTALALFVPDYIDMKEQKEYLRWLSNVKSFVEA